jgi:Tol biopolymer transport system component
MPVASPERPPAEAAPPCLPTVAERLEDRVDPTAPIEEARGRARWRRLRLAAAAALTAAAIAAVAMALDTRDLDAIDTGDRARDVAATLRGSAGAIAYGDRLGLFLVGVDRTGRHRPRAKLADCVPDAPGAQCEIGLVAWSPDGRSIAFVQGTPSLTGPSTMTLRVVGLDGAAPRVVATCLHECDWQWRTPLSWSADSTRVRYVDDRRSWVVDADGGTAAKAVGPSVDRARDDNAATWSPDRKLIASLSTPGARGRHHVEVWLVGADGSGRRRVYAGRCCLLVSARPAWSPGGRVIAFTDLSASPDRPGALRGGAFTIDVGTGKLRRLTPVGRGSELLAWQPRPASSRATR